MIPSPACRPSRQPDQTGQACRRSNGDLAVTPIPGTRSKQELGLGHYEGRGWRGFHHHAAFCIAAYGFLITERSLIPPSGLCSAPIRQAPALPDGYRPRGSARPA
uniref:Transposase n=1 Tax=Magnetospirillum gryphiswaldense TaxID=55518 RepID=A4U593_9PROT|nr:transposase, fragment [Magnetospirillum gryphiswaldense MSR-1]